MNSVHNLQPPGHRSLERKDRDLAFFASEVMLFGGLFSAYIFLRIDSTAGMWPHGLLKCPGRHE